VPPKKENVQARYMNKDTRKKINVENPTGRPLEFAFDRQKGDLAITSMRSDVPRTTYFQQVDSASKTLADDHKNQEIDHACPRHIKYMQQEIFANVGDEEARLKRFLQESKNIPSTVNTFLTEMEKKHHSSSTLSNRSGDKSAKKKSKILNINQDEMDH
jgi:hypothetical protein